MEKGTEDVDASRGGMSDTRWGGMNDEDAAADAEADADADADAWARKRGAVLLWALMGEGGFPVVFSFFVLCLNREEREGEDAAAVSSSASRCRG